MGYTEKQCIEEISEVYKTENLNALYDNDFINRRGSVVDSGRAYDEVYAQFIYEHLIDGQLPFVYLPTVKEYCGIDRASKKGTKEEAVQRQFYNSERTLDKKFGIPIWFELQVHRNGKGIDLVYYNSEKDEINIFELKSNSDNTLLHTLLEIQTYYQRVDWGRAIKALKKKELLKSEYLSRINKYLLVSDDCTNIDKKFKSLTEDSFVKKLLDTFKIEVIYY